MSFPMPHLNNTNSGGPLAPGLRASRRQDLGMPGFLNNDSVSTTAGTYHYSPPMPRMISQSVIKRDLSAVMSSLQQQPLPELGTMAPSWLTHTTYKCLLNLINIKRTRKEVPTEGSEYDKALSWAKLFVERLHAFEENIQDFASNSSLAAELAYDHCAMLLETGRKDSRALMITFGFLNTASMAVGNLLERSDMFSAVHDTQDELVQVLVDMITLVACVSTSFQNATDRHSDTLYEKFPNQMKNFRQRCVKIEESMWKHELDQNDVDGKRATNLKAIKSWLAPKDPVLVKKAETGSHLAHDRGELTCRWVEPRLKQFLRDPRQILAITGGPGMGKSVLATVITDHLQHPIDRVAYNTIFVKIDGRVPAECSPRAVARSILYQLFETQIGNVGLFDVLHKAHQRSMKTIDGKVYDDILWEALESALTIPMHNEKLAVMVVDGVDEVAAGEDHLLQRLHRAICQKTDIKLVTLGAREPTDDSNQIHIPITDELVFDDVSAVVLRDFSSSSGFLELERSKQENLLSDIAQASGGSFLWAKLVTERVRHEPNPESLEATVQTMITDKPLIDDLVLETLKGEVRLEAKRMLLWLATANRPLRLRELSTLANISGGSPPVTDKSVLSTMDPLVSLLSVEGDRVGIRHGHIRAVVLDSNSREKLVPGIHDIHADLTERLLIYIRNKVTGECGPALNPLEWFDASPSLNKHPLLDFALRYFIHHYLERTTDLGLNSESLVKTESDFFPSSDTVPLLARSIWENLATPDLVEYHSIFKDLCCQFRTPTSRLTLQATIFLARLFDRVGDIPQALDLSYQVTVDSQKTLGVSHVITMKTAIIFLELSIKDVSTDKVKLVEQTEQLLTWLAEGYKANYDKASEEDISIMKELVEHYSTSQDEDMAIGITHKTMGILNNIQCTNSFERVSGSTGQRQSPLTAGAQVAAAETVGLWLDIEEEDEVTQVTDFESLIHQVEEAKKSHEERSIERAERIYMETLDLVFTESRKHTSVLWEDRKRSVVLAYAQFLLSQERGSEASAILSSYWQEFEQTTITESSVPHLQELAKVVEDAGLPTVALDVLKQCCQYYSSVNKTESSIYKRIQQHVQSLSKEVWSSSSSLASEATIEKMIDDAAFSSAMDKTAYKNVERLVDLYTLQHQWEDAIRVTKKVLHRVWPALFASSINDVVLPRQNPDKSVALAERLCTIYRSGRSLADEENIRMRLYYALRRGHKVEDKLRQRITSGLLKVLERGSQTNSIIRIYQELLDDYIARYGIDSDEAINTLCKLADLIQPRSKFVQYYQDVIKALNKDLTRCHHKAFDLLIIVATELWDQGRYADALDYYRLVFVTFFTQANGNPRLQDPTFIREIFARYSHCLRTVNTKSSTLREINMKYQSTVKAVFGPTASITVQATLDLAKICQQSKDSQLEAIACYKELLNITSDEIERYDINDTLTSIYEEQAWVASTSNDFELISSSQVECAAQVLKQRLTEVRETYGWAHEGSLSQMQEMVQFYTNHNETQRILQELQEATTTILSTETSPFRLSNAAAAIATSYMTSNQSHKLPELSRDIYQQVIAKHTEQSASLLNVDLSSKKRQSLVFLAQLEHKHSQQSSSVAEILTSLTAEYVYFEEFRQQLWSRTKLSSITSLAARLHQQLLSHSRPDVAARVVEDLANHFRMTEGEDLVRITDDNESPPTASQIKVFVRYLLEHFGTHRSENFVRSVGIMGNHYVRQLLHAQCPDAAYDLALVSFRYLSVQPEYHSHEVVKLAVNLGVAISGHDAPPHVRLSDPSLKKLQDISGEILSNALSAVRKSNLSLSHRRPAYLNALVKTLSAKREFSTLAWLLQDLWSASCDPNSGWEPSLVNNLQLLSIQAQYQQGNHREAAQRAENIVYNSKRVYGYQNSSTLRMSVLLSQMYIDMGRQRKGDSAQRYYKKTTEVFEKALWAFAYGSSAGRDVAVPTQRSTIPAGGGISTFGRGTSGVVDTQQVRKHFDLLKLAVKRLEKPPKEVSEYQRWQTNLKTAFPEAMEGVAEAEDWDLGSSGDGLSGGDEDPPLEEQWEWQLLD